MLSVALLILLVSFHGIQLNAENEKAPIVTISLGQIRGSLSKSYYGRPFQSFKGIPYAQEPTGNLRFKPPKPIDQWSDILDATNEGSVCIQWDEDNKRSLGSENCLFLNVFVPEIQDSEGKLLPIMVFIHGGGFATGSGSPSFYGPDKLMDYDVILVTFNYRLGMFGFLSTQDSASPGNYGLLDQVLVLKWIKENIANFGGDPEQVTIFGHSAGAMSVSLHTLSPLSTGLFSRAIAQSGTTLSPSSVIKNPLKWAKALAENVNCPSKDSQELVACVQLKTAEEVVIGNSKLQKIGMLPFTVGPVVERAGGVGFLTADPKKLLEEGRIINKVPFIAGIVPDEGYFINLALRKYYQKNGREFLDEQFPLFLSYLYDVDRDMSDVISKMEGIYYKQAKLIANKDFFNIILGKVLTDCVLTAGITKTLDYFAEAGVPTLAYFFTHMGQHSVAEFIGGVAGRYITHGDELLLQFQVPTIESMTTGTKPIMNSNDAKASQLLNTLWVDFASGKTPRIKAESGDFDWLPHDVTNRSHLNINLTNLGMRSGKLSEKFDFWIDEVEQLIKEGTVKDEL